MRSRLQPEARVSGSRMTAARYRCRSPGTGHRRCLCRNANVPWPLMLCPPWKNSISVRSAEAELRVEAAHFRVFVRDPLIPADQIVMAALDHEGPRDDQLRHLRVVERVAQFQYGISHSIVRMKLKG